MKTGEQIESKIQELRRDMEQEKQKDNQYGVFGLDVQIMTLRWVFDD